MNIKSVTRLSLLLGALIALPLALSGCESAENADTIAADNPPPQNVQQDPPMIPVETVPFISNPAAEIWRPGYWAMSGGQFVWVPGRIIPRPSPTAVWASAHWVHHTFGWSFEEGHWE